MCVLITTLLFRASSVPWLIFSMQSAFHYDEKRKKILLAMTGKTMFSYVAVFALILNKWKRVILFSNRGSRKEQYFIIKTKCELKRGKEGGREVG